MKCVEIGRACNTHEMKINAVITISRFGDSCKLVACYAPYEEQVKSRHKGRKLSGCSGSW